MILGGFFMEMGQSRERGSQCSLYIGKVKEVNDLLVSNLYLFESMQEEFKKLTDLAKDLIGNGVFEGKDTYKDSLIASLQNCKNQVNNFSDDLSEEESQRKFYEVKFGIYERLESVRKLFIEIEDFIIPPDLSNNIDNIENRIKEAFNKIDKNPDSFDLFEEFITKEFKKFREILINDLSEKFDNYLTGLQCIGYNRATNPEEQFHLSRAEKFIGAIGAIQNSLLQLGTDNDLNKSVKALSNFSFYQDLEYSLALYNYDHNLSDFDEKTKLEVCTAIIEETNAYVYGVRNNFNLAYPSLPDNFDKNHLSDIRNGIKDFLVNKINSSDRLEKQKYLKALKSLGSEAFAELRELLNFDEFHEYLLNKVQSISHSNYPPLFKLEDTKGQKDIISEEINKSVKDLLADLTSANITTDMKNKIKQTNSNMCNRIILIVQEYAKLFDEVPEGFVDQFKELLKKEFVIDVRESELYKIRNISQKVLLDLNKLSP